MTMQSHKHYVCELCGEECKADNKWDDDKATAEFKAKFPGEPLTDENVLTVCDDCYRAMGLGDN